MQRFSNTHGIVLHTYRIGELHKGVVLLTPNRGIVRAVAHGAKKITSRLRSSSETFCLSQLHLYYDPVRDSQKITEAHVKEPFSGLRQSLPRYYTACLWAEIVIKSFAAGDHGIDIYELFGRSLRVLNGADPNSIHYLSCQFLWRFLKIAGLKPDTSACVHCGRNFNDRETVTVGRLGSGFSCNQCDSELGLKLPSGARKYLSVTERMTLNKSLNVSLEHKTRDQLETALFGLLESVLEIRLNSIHSVRSVG